MPRFTSRGIELRADNYILNRFEGLDISRGVIGDFIIVQVFSKLLSYGKQQLIDEMTFRLTLSL